MRDLAEDLARLPEEVQALVWEQYWQRALRLPPAEFAAAVDSATAVDSAPVASARRAVLDRVVADELWRRRGDFPFSGRGAREVHGILTDIRQPEYETVCPDDTVSVLLRLAALTDPGSVLDRGVQKHIRQLFKLSEINYSLGVGRADHGYRLLLGDDDAIGMLGKLRVDTGYYLRTYHADLARLVSELEATPLSGWKAKLFSKKVFWHCNEENPVFKKYQDSLFEHSGFDMSECLLEVYRGWQDGLWQSQDDPVYFEHAEHVEVFREELAAELVRVAAAVAAIPPPAVLIRQQRANAQVLRRCFPHCSKWLTLVADAASRSRTRRSRRYNMLAAAIAFLQAAAIEPDDRLADSILSWLMSLHTYTSWSPPPAILPARAEQISAVCRKLQE